MNICFRVLAYVAILSGLALQGVNAGVHPQWMDSAADPSQAWIDPKNALSQVKVASETSLQLSSEVLNRQMSRLQPPQAFVYFRSDYGRAQMVTFEQQRDGSITHIAWYNDGYIVTVLSGYEPGQQELHLYDGRYYAPISCCEGDGCLIHDYSWGVIYSYLNKQVIEFD